MRIWNLGIKTLAAVGAAVVLCAGFCLADMMFSGRRGFSARGQPSKLETTLARTMRGLSIASRARELANPVKSTPQVLAEARAHWGDHCAICHGNDGSGDTMVSAGMYPKAPDMRLPMTQELTDGELYYLIQNGVRMTGMPGWGDADDETAEESWALVHFIRHLPNLTEGELEEMSGVKPDPAAEAKDGGAEADASEHHEAGVHVHKDGQRHVHHH